MATHTAGAWDSPRARAKRKMYLGLRGGGGGEQMKGKSLGAEGIQTLSSEGPRQSQFLLIESPLWQPSNCQF